ncbi:hypothetical protein LCGC14_1992560 [marine sediment metagenome]|uniref:Uncharacterized protein n=1 Tax=marine sediment metagenome TaxID=412755 RepID=A0A0F9F5T5_9ZZZZ
MSEPETEEVDETFEIISEKQKLWQDYLVTCETNYINSEASMIQNSALIKLAKEEIKKESDKNAH